MGYTFISGVSLVFCFNPQIHNLREVIKVVVAKNFTRALRAYATSLYPATYPEYFLDQRL